MLAPGDRRRRPSASDREQWRALRLRIWKVPGNALDAAYLHTRQWLPERSRRVPRTDGNISDQQPGSRPHGLPRFIRRIGGFGNAQHSGFFLLVRTMVVSNFGFIGTKLCGGGIATPFGSGTNAVSIATQVLSHTSTQDLLPALPMCRSPGV
ncbi:hypothetical protein BDW59DRAFT_2092 [Aspergillus cavernicola]|uniref:Uncharacterized protein n=1 Tax=Aspergillus cavernicola TaxID=176166 RepID=A0ABR4J4U0_9EURO